jgi:hypothetical protein
VDVVSADPPPEVTAVPMNGGPAGIVTAPVHLVGPDSEGVVGNVQDGVQTPAPTILGASPMPTPSATPTAGKRPLPGASNRPMTSPTPRHPAGSSGKSLLPPGLPRERQ